MKQESREAFIQNLIDAGCGREHMDCIMECMEQGSREELLKLLEEHRECLLGRLHEEEKQIDCLDYLVYQIGRNSDIT